MLYLKDLIDVAEYIKDWETGKEAVVIDWEKWDEVIEITWARYNEEEDRVEIYINK